MELYAGRNPVRRWCAELADRDDGLVLSPYVTSTTAETVLSKGSSTLCTLFEPRLFLTGASSLQTLAKLSRAGCRILHISDLHAKVVLVPNRFASVGSQNLTLSGTRRREATIAIDDPALIELLQAEVDEWLADAQVVTLQMIEMLDDLLRPLMKRQKALFAELGKTEALFSEKVGELNEAERRRQRVAALTARRIQQLKQAVQAASSVGRTQRVELRNVPSGEWGELELWTLMAESQDLLNWGSGSLSKTFRYLIVDQATGKLGWARVMKTRISFIASGIDWTDRMRLGPHIVAVSFEALDPREGRGNIRARVAGVSVDAWFTVDGLKDPLVVVTRSSDRTAEVAEYVRSSWPDASQSLAAKLLKPFIYKRNLNGVSPRKFLGRDYYYGRLELKSLGKKRRFLSLTAP